MTCKDCVHCEACDMMYENIKKESVEGKEYPNGAEKCKCFKDKKWNKILNNIIVVIKDILFVILPLVIFGTIAFFILEYIALNITTKLIAAFTLFAMWGIAFCKYIKWLNEKYLL